MVTASREEILEQLRQRLNKQLDEAHLTGPASAEIQKQIRTFIHDIASKLNTPEAIRTDINNWIREQERQMQNGQLCEAVKAYCNQTLPAFLQTARTTLNQTIIQQSQAKEAALAESIRAAVEQQQKLQAAAEPKGLEEGKGIQAPSPAAAASGSWFAGWGTWLGFGSSDPAAQSLLGGGRPDDYTLMTDDASSTRKPPIQVVVHPVPVAGAGAGAAAAAPPPPVVQPPAPAFNPATLAAALNRVKITDDIQALNTHLQKAMQDFKITLATDFAEADLSRNYLRDAFRQYLDLQAQTPRTLARLLASSVSNYLQSNNDTDITSNYSLSSRVATLIVGELLRKDASYNSRQQLEQLRDQAKALVPVTDGHAQRALDNIFNQFLLRAAADKDGKHRPQPGPGAGSPDQKIKIEPAAAAAAARAASPDLSEEKARQSMELQFTNLVSKIDQLTPTLPAYQEIRELLIGPQGLFSLDLINNNLIGLSEFLSNKDRAVAKPKPRGHEDKKAQAPAALTSFPKCMSTLFRILALTIAKETQAGGDQKLKANAEKILLSLRTQYREALTNRYHPISQYQYSLTDLVQQTLVDLTRGPLPAEFTAVQAAAITTLENTFALEKQLLLQPKPEVSAPEAKLRSLARSSSQPDLAALQQYSPQQVLLEKLESKLLKHWITEAVKEQALRTAPSKGGSHGQIAKTFNDHKKSPSKLKRPTIQLPCVLKFDELAKIPRPDLEQRIASFNKLVNSGASSEKIRNFLNTQLHIWIPNTETTHALKAEARGLHTIHGPVGQLLATRLAAAPTSVHSRFLKYDEKIAASGDEGGEGRLYNYETVVGDTKATVNASTPFRKSTSAFIRQFNEQADLIARAIADSKLQSSQIKRITDCIVDQTKTAQDMTRIMQIILSENHDLKEPGRVEVKISDRAQVAIAALRCIGIPDTGAGTISDSSLQGSLFAGHIPSQTYPSIAAQAEQLNRQAQALIPQITNAVTQLEQKQAGYCDATVRTISAELDQLQKVPTAKDFAQLSQQLEGTLGNAANLLSNLLAISQQIELLVTKLNAIGQVSGPQSDEVSRIGIQVAQMQQSLRAAIKAIPNVNLLETFLSFQRLATTDYLSHLYTRTATRVEEIFDANYQSNNNLDDVVTAHLAQQLSSLLNAAQTTFGEATSHKTLTEAHDALVAKINSDCKLGGGIDSAFTYLSNKVKVARDQSEIMSYLTAIQRLEQQSPARTADQISKRQNLDEKFAGFVPPDAQQKDASGKLDLKAFRVRGYSILPENHHSQLALKRFAELEDQYQRKLKEFEHEEKHKSAAAAQPLLAGTAAASSSASAAAAASGSASSAAASEHHAAASSSASSPAATPAR